MAKLTFLGAAGTVTGSKYLVEAGGKRLLVDCGLFQGEKELRLRNWAPLPIPPATIDWVLLTHAHIDHTGYLPRLVRDGFRGPIFANSGTSDLANILLPDSAYLQEEDAAYAGKMGSSKHSPALPLYTVEDAQAALHRLQTFPRSDEFRISPEFAVRGYDAGHILGSASLELRVTENGRSMTVVFSGDVGRYDQPILNNPQTPPRADTLLCESTYGDRDHPAGSVLDVLAGVINRVAQRGGSVVIPAFAVGRVQTLLYLIRQLEDSQRIPRLPTYVDSPMAIHATELYLAHREDYSPQFARETREGDPLNTHEVHMTRTVEESKQINRMTQPCLILSASGMATGGRVLHHLEQRLPDARNAVLLAGFQAVGTRGRSLAEGAKTLRMYGKDFPVRAEIVEMRQLSAHAGQSELMRWFGAFQAPPQQTYLVHGEPPALQALQTLIREKLRWQVAVAAYQQTVELTFPQ
jgi:metallo-beta-lactamase family protein